MVFSSLVFFEFFRKGVYNLCIQPFIEYILNARHYATCLQFRIEETVAALE